MKRKLPNPYDLHAIGEHHKRFKKYEKKPIASNPYSVKLTERDYERIARICKK